MSCFENFAEGLHIKGKFYTSLTGRRISDEGCKKFFMFVRLS